VIAGFSGWAAIGAWWLRERTKSVRALKELRKRNDRLQRSVIFTLAKWREQVEQARVLFAIEQEYAERLAREAGVSPRDVKTTVRATVEAQYSSRSEVPSPSSSSVNRQVETIEQVQRYVESGEGALAEIEISDEIRRVA
jgi:hypothetical protein